MSDLTAETRAWQRRQENAGHASVLAVGSLLGLGANRLLRGAGADGKVGAALGGIAGTLLVFQDGTKSVQGVECKSGYGPQFGRDCRAK